MHFSYCDHKGKGDVNVLKVEDWFSKIRMGKF